jgi:hypothetical protein
MKNSFVGAAVLLLAGGWCLGQQSAINSPSLSPNQNQILTGETGYYPPPAPSFDGGVPDASDRVSGMPANATTLHPGSGPLQPQPTAGQKTTPAPRSKRSSRTSKSAKSQQ